MPINKKYKLVESKEYENLSNKNCLDLYVQEGEFNTFLRKNNNSDDIFFSLKTKEKINPDKSNSFWKSANFKFVLKFDELLEASKNDFSREFMNEKHKINSIFKNKESNIKKCISEMKIIFEWLNSFLENIPENKKKDILLSFSTEIFDNESSNELDATFLLRSPSGNFQIFNIEVKNFDFIILDLHNEHFYKIEAKKLLSLHKFYYSWVIKDELINVYIVKTKNKTKTFYKSFSFNDNEKFIWTSKQEIKNEISNEIIQNYNIEDYFNDNLVNRFQNRNSEIDSWIKVINLDDIQKILEKISKKDILIINGPPGTGKTLMFLYLEKHFGDEAYSVILNKYFLIEGESWHKTNSELRKKYNEQPRKYLIIDEAQLSSQELIEDAIKHKMKIIFIGDNLQKLRTKLYPKFSLDLLRVINKSIEIDNHELKNFIRFSLISLNWVKFFLNLDKEKINKLKATHNFLISTEKDFDTFMKKFKDNCSDGATVMGTISDFKKSHFPSHLEKEMHSILYLDPLCPESFESKIANSKEKYLYNTYQLISFEYNKIFIYLPESLIFNGKESFYKNEKNDEIIYELWIIFTRARKEIVIFSENDETKKYFLKKQEEFDKKNKKNS